MSGLQGVGTTTHPVVVHERPDEEEQSDDPFAAMSQAQPTDERDSLTLQDLQDMRDAFGDRITGIDVDLSGMGEIENGDKDPVSTTINPALMDSIDMRGGEVEFGRGISDKDMQGQRPVAVVSPELVDAMFDGDPASASLDDEDEDHISVLIDGSALEIFAGGGAVTFSSRFRPEVGATGLRVSTSGDAQILNQWRRGAAR